MLSRKIPHAEITKQALKTYLKGKICQNGRMTVPQCSVLTDAADAAANASIETVEVPNATLKVVTTKQDKDKVKRFMLDKFYTSAPIPNAIKLKDTWQKYPYLDDELDLMLDSKASIGIYENSTNRLLASQINTIWNVDPDPAELPLTDPTLWLNVAAEIAQEETSDPFYRTVIWRDYHFQLIYHLVQGHARKLLCDQVMYAGMGFTEPELRKKGASGIAMFLSGGLEWSRQNNSIITFMTTVPKFHEKTQKSLSGMFDTLAIIPYKDLNFKPRQDDKNVFGNIDGAMVLMASKKCQ